MEARLQRRVQRYGWDQAAPHYESLWEAQLAPSRRALVECAGFRPGDQVLDVACGTGLVAFEAQGAVGSDGYVVGVDISGAMVEAARGRAREHGACNIGFARMDAESLELADSSFDVAVCALGFMYFPEPARALAELQRVLKPGGRLVIAVWGKRSCCGWAEVFPIVDSEVESDVCPMFFDLGQQDALAQLCTDAGFELTAQRRVSAPLRYADADEACDAVFVGGPVALAWSRFDPNARRRARARYLESIAEWRSGQGYRVPGEFVVVAARKPAG
jgi:ubiquinone/menaquinone biosynthesis C-methylase UbiE